MVRQDEVGTQALMFAELLHRLRSTQPFLCLCNYMKMSADQHGLLQYDSVFVRVDRMASLTIVICGGQWVYVRL